MERNTAAIIAARNKLIGGLYGDWHTMITEKGFLGPSTDRNVCFFFSQVLDGYLVQFGSGHSAVAPSQKEAILCILIAMHVELWGMSVSEAITNVISGSTPYLHIMNFGDDNFWSSDSQEHLEQAFQFISDILPTETEVPPKFLGFVWDEERRKFMLPASSYLLRTYLHERPPFGYFRKFAFFGWVEKRKVYLQYGDTRLMEEIFDYENTVLKRAGLDWLDIEEEARKEAQQLEDVDLNPDAILGRDYRLTPEEKIASGLFDGMMPDETKPIFDRLTAGGILENT
jgi:hypothetical protein